MPIFLQTAFLILCLFEIIFKKVTGHKTFDPVPYPYYSYIFICIQILSLQLSVFITSHDILDPLIRI